MVSQAERGSHIGILSLTDGAAGHQTMGRAALASRRRAEAEQAADLVNAELTIWDQPDGELAPTVDLRKRLVGDIRRFAPELIVTHRPYDYHPDHRATALLVQDACYLLRVPNFEADVTALAADPYVLGMADFFTRPLPFQADLVLSLDPCFEAVLDLLSCHASQLFEWLPFITGEPVVGDRREWLASFYGRRSGAIAKRYAPHSRYAEAFELSEYGRRAPLDLLQRKLGSFQAT